MLLSRDPFVQRQYGAEYSRGAMKGWNDLIDQSRAVQLNMYENLSRKGVMVKFPYTVSGNTVFAASDGEEAFIVREGDHQARYPVAVANAKMKYAYLFPGNLHSKMSRDGFSTWQWRYAALGLPQEVDRGSVGYRKR